MLRKGFSEIYRYVTAILLFTLGTVVIIGSFGLWILEILFKVAIVILGVSMGYAITKFIAENLLQMPK